MRAPSPAPPVFLSANCIYHGSAEALSLQSTFVDFKFQSRSRLHLLQTKTSVYAVGMVFGEVIKTRALCYPKQLEMRWCPRAGEGVQLILAFRFEGPKAPSCYHSKVARPPDTRSGTGPT